jgi:regulator of protease activity HflC (stomatin/prohibitin superfamily)
MENAFAWLRDIADWLGRFVPRWEVVPTTHGWVKFVRGSRIVTGGSGIVWWWPVTTRMLDYPIVRQTITLPTQVVVTTDNIEIAVSAMLVFEIADLERILAHTYDPEETVRDIAATSLHDVCTEMTWEEIRTGGRKLRTRLTNEAKKDLAEYGVKPLKFALMTCAKCSVARVIRSDFREGSEMKSGG